MIDMNGATQHVSERHSITYGGHAVFGTLSPDSYSSHSLHDAGRDWSETNCFVDVWIEVVHAFGSDPRAMLGAGLALDFEGDQFTFFKMPLGDIEELYGIRTEELAIYDDPERHILTQVERGRLAMLELDSFYLPDTAGTTYGTTHGKTMVAFNRIDPKARTAEYFHNGGYYRLRPNDYRGLFRHDDRDPNMPFLPYAEYARFPAERPTDARLRRTAVRLLAHHLHRRPLSNPVAEFSSVFPSQAEALADREFDVFHLYAFNTLRQLGATYELVADQLDWLSGRFGVAACQARTISSTAKTAQFRLARAVMRNNVSSLDGTLDPAIKAWDELMAVLTTLV